MTEKYSVSPIVSRHFLRKIVLACETVFQTTDQRRLRQAAADEDEHRFARFAVRPGAARVGAHRHVNALENNPLVLPRESNDALVAQQIGRVRSDLNPRLQTLPK